MALVPKSPRKCAKCNQYLYFLGNAGKWMHYVRQSLTDQCSKDVQECTNYCANCSEKIYFIPSTGAWYHHYRATVCYDKRGSPTLNHAKPGLTMQEAEAMFAPNEPIVEAKKTEKPIRSITFED